MSTSPGRAAPRMLKTLAGALALSAAHSPLAGLAARTIAPVVRRHATRRLDHSPHPLASQLQQVLGPLTPADAVTLSRRIETNGVRNALVRRALLLGRAPAALRRLRWIDDGGLGAMHRERRAALAVFCHVGHGVPTGLILEHVGVRPLVFTGRPLEGSSGLARGEWLVVGRASTPNPGERALALKRALTWLKQGHVVVISLDGATNADEPFCLPFFGRVYPFGRGTAALARLSGAAIVPIVKSWSADGVMEVRSYPPIEAARRTGLPPDAADRALTADIAAWFEACLRAAPEGFRVRTILNLSRAPLAAGVPPGEPPR